MSTAEPLSLGEVYAEIVELNYQLGRADAHATLVARLACEALLADDPERAATLARRWRGLMAVADDLRSQLGQSTSRPPARAAGRSRTAAARRRDDSATGNRRVTPST